VRKVLAVLNGLFLASWVGTFVVLLSGSRATTEPSVEAEALGMLFLIMAGTVTVAVGLNTWSLLRPKGVPTVLLVIANLLPPPLLLHLFPSVGLWCLFPIPPLLWSSLPLLLRRPPTALDSEYQRFVDAQRPRAPNPDTQE
jgi:hypothetical protein